MLQNEKLRAVLAAFPEAEVWMTADSAEPAARSAYVDPDSLPLLLLCDRPRHIIHAAAGYRIGSIEKRFGIDLGQFGTRERLISCYRCKILTSNKFRQLLV